MKPERKQKQTVREPAGNGSALHAILPELYDELKALARAQLRRERPGHTLQATALVNEVYLRLAQQHRLDATSRATVVIAAASVIRRVLTDYARARASKKRGGARRRTRLTALEIIDTDPETTIDLMELDDALTQLADLNPRAARVVELRFFGNLSVAECAQALDVSERTVANDWVVARAWLRRELGGQNNK